MADNWEFASFVVAVLALVLTLSPLSLKFFAALFSEVLRRTWRSLGKCERLEWQDIPDGPLHLCASPKPCNHIGTDESAPSWERTIVDFFKVRRGNFVRKPKQLNLFTTYIRTDKKTLRVCLSLLNLPELRGTEMGETPFRIVFKEVEGVMTAYIHIRRLPSPRLTLGYRLDVTKREMELILQGYPPWYKNPLRLVHGRAVAHPIRDHSDLLRGGWLLAVGLSRTRPVATDFQADKDQLELILNKAFDRVEYCMENLKHALPDEKMIDVARTLMKGVREENIWGHSGSHLNKLFEQAKFKGFKDYPYFPPGPYPDFGQDMSDEQIETAMKVFSDNSPPTREQVAELEPVLDRVLAAVLFGVYRVVRYLYVYGAGEYRPYKVPPELEGDGFIYVRERWDSIED